MKKNPVVCLMLLSALSDATVSSIQECEGENKMDDNFGWLIERLQVAALDAGCLLLAIVLFVASTMMIERCVKAVISSIAGESACYALEAYATFPGVVFHEASHALFAAVLGAKITRCSLVQQRTEKGTILGCVEFIPRGVQFAQSMQIVCSAIAPAITCFAAFMAIAFLIIPICDQWWQIALCIYALVCLVLHCDLSHQDIKSALHGIPVVAIVMVLFFFLFPVYPADLIVEDDMPASSSSEESMQYDISLPYSS